MSPIERTALVDESGILVGIAPGKAVPEGSIAAVELTLAYDPSRHVIVLFSRGVGASDMRTRWALQSGKVLEADLTAEDAVGRVLSIEAFRNAAVRELAEEVLLEVPSGALEHVDSFYMRNGTKQLFFTLLGLPLDETQVARLRPNQPEVAACGLFTLERFRTDPDLGDAIQFRREEMIVYLERVFAGRSQP